MIVTCLIIVVIFNACSIMYSIRLRRTLLLWLSQLPAADPYDEPGIGHEL